MGCNRRCALAGCSAWIEDCDEIFCTRHLIEQLRYEESKEDKKEINDGRVYTR